MTRFIILTVFVLSLSIAAAAQRQRTEPVGDTAPQKGGKSGTAALNGTKPLVLSDTALEATLMSSLDVRRSKVGDEVILKTTKTIKQNGEVVIPKGSRLNGRITEVQQKGGGNADSKLGLVFERVEGKGLAAPITASIVSITDARAVASVGDSTMADLTGTSSTRTTASRGGSGGGLLGGVGSTVGGVVGGATQTVSSVAGTAVNTTGSAIGTVGGTLRGVQISQAASGSANGSAMLSANDKSLKVYKGVTFNLLVNSSTGN